MTVVSSGVRVSTSQGRWIIVATALGSGMIFLDGTVVNVALPRIQSDLAAPLSGLQWVVNAYTLLLASLLLVGGDLGDLFGRKRIFAGGLVIFTLASIGCGLAPNLLTLILARAVQGMGGALLVPGSLAIIQAVMVPEDRGRAIGLWAGLSGASTAIGPLLGGYLVGAVSWRAVFFLNVPLAAATLYALLVHVPPKRNRSASRTLDWFGAVSIAVGLGGITFGLIEGPGLGWSTPIVLAALGLGILGLILFPIHEVRATSPMVPLGIFRSHNFTGSNLASLGVYFAFSGSLLFLTLDLQQVEGYSPLAAGAALLPITILLLLLSPRMGTIVSRFGGRLPMTLGPIVIAAGFLYLMTTSRDSPYPTGFLPGIVIMGLGMSIFVTPLTATVMSALPEHLAGIASGVNNAATRVASLLAIAVLGVIVAARFNADLPGNLAHAGLSSRARTAIIAGEDRLANDPISSDVNGSARVAARHAIADAFVSGFHWVIGTCALLCMLAAGASWWTIRSETSRSPEP